MPHHIIQAEMGATPNYQHGITPINVQYPTTLGGPETKVLKFGTYIIKRNLLNTDIHSWYVEMRHWFKSHGISINALPPFQHRLDHQSRCPMI